MVFQCSVFLAGAATETYIKLILEAWVQKMKAEGLGALAPAVARAFIAMKKLEKKFAQYQFTGDEKTLNVALMSERYLWALMSGDPNLPPFFDGRALHEGSGYPSSKNIKRLFARVGIENMVGRLSSNLGRDAEVMIENFQSIRTALAHSAPPAITIDDVERLLADSKELVGAVDRIFHNHIMRHGGSACWPS